MGNVTRYLFKEISGGFQNEVNNELQNEAGVISADDSTLPRSRSKSKAVHAK